MQLCKCICSELVLIANFQQKPTAQQYMLNHSWEWLKQVDVEYSCVRCCQ
eukprot:c39802_g1_i1 orf=67-216(+)